MTSKTFKSAYAEHGNQKLNIIDVDDGVRVSADHGSHGAKGIIIAPSDAPAVCLAILEAAGVEAKPSNDDPGTPGNLGRIAYQLMIHIEDAENITAVAKAQEELEAEALRLFNASRIARGLDEIDWVLVTPSERAEWLAVARAARELNKEDGQ